MKPDDRKPQPKPPVDAKPLPQAEANPKPPEKKQMRLIDEPEPPAPSYYDL